MKKKKKFKFSIFLSFAVSVAIGVVGGLAAGPFFDRLEETGLSSLMLLCIFFAMLFTSLFVQIIIHEAGHLVFGLISGYKFGSFRIGSAVLYKQNGKFKLGLYKLAGTAGQCLMCPPGTKDEKFPVMLYNLGGSSFNLISSLIALAFCFIFKERVWVVVPLGTLAIFGFIFALSNGLPLKTRTVNTDGYNAFSLLKNAEARSAFWLQLKIHNEYTSENKRLSDMPDEWFEIPTDEAMKNSMVSATGVFACNRLMEQQRFEEADRAMAHLLEIESGMVGVHRYLLTCDRIFCEIINENRMPVLFEMRSNEQLKFMKSMKNSLSVIRTEYAYHLISLSDKKSAERIKEKFEKAAKNHPHPMDVQSERALIRLAEEIADKKDSADE